MPDACIHKLKIGSFRMSFREAPLTLTTLAALVPKELNANIKIVDESVEDIPFQEQFDLVGISCLTGTSIRAYEIADYFRRQGAVIVLGGVHVSLRPEEAARHANSIVIGFAEQTWPELLADFTNKQLKDIYRGNNVSLFELPLPRRDLQKRFGYTMPQTVFATRGCHGHCSFCTVPAVPFGWHTRPVGEVIQEIRLLPRRRFAFNDVNLVSDRDYAMELFTALIPLKKKWGGLASLSLADDSELLDVIARSGCQYLLLGFESIKQSSLGELNKGFNRAENYRNAMRAFHNHNIVVQGCFIFGMDDDNKDIFSNTVDAINDLQIDIPRFAIYTPYPGTDIFSMMKSQNRILHESWQYYDTQHVVFQPAQMTPDELYTGFSWAYQKTFSKTLLLKRTLISPHPVISFLGNTAYRLYVDKLKRKAQSISAFRSVPGLMPLAQECNTLLTANSCLNTGGQRG